MEIFLLILFAILPAGLTVGFFFLLTKTKFKDWKKIYKTIIIGVTFGLLCILTTEFGPKTSMGVPLNGRTVAVVTASFVFGWPAGLIAAVIGSLERGLSLLWNESRAFTEIACTTATLVAGVVAGLLRKFMFDDKTPTPIAGMLVAFVVETFHMLLVFLTNMGEINKALMVIEDVTFKMLLSNSLGVFLSLLVESLLLYFYGMEDRLFRTRKKKIATSIQINLIFVVLACFAASLVVTYFVEEATVKETSANTILTNITDIKKEISDKSDHVVLTISDSVAQDVERQNMAGLNPRYEEFKDKPWNPSDALNAEAQRFASMMNVSEVNFVNDEGYIYATNVETSWKFNMASTEQSKAFNDYLLGSKSTEIHYAQKFGPIGSDKRIEKKYGGTRLSSVGGYIQVGFNADQYYSVINVLIDDSTTYKTVGSEGRLMIATNYQKVVSDKKSKDDTSPDSKGQFVNKYLNDRALFGFDINERKADVLNLDSFAGSNTYYIYQTVEGYYIVGTMSENEVKTSLSLTVYITSFIEIIVYALLVILAYAFIDNVIVKRINKVNDELNDITSGNLDVTVDVLSHQEFETLSTDINQTVDKLKQYIDEANKRIDRELYFAKQIQMSSLPAPLEIKPSLDLYSLMSTAKEVGGDFYDFYYLDDNHIVILVADVSGKGIPAAMFMMKCKTLIKSLVEKGLHPEEAFYEANNELCRNNDAEMFVTAWMAIINIKDGSVEFCNAGHNAPLFGTQSKHDFHYFKSRPNLVLGGMEGVPYIRGTYTLQENETIFLYTDGVTESTNMNKELFGEQRLLDLLNKADGLANRMIVKSVKQAVDEFAGECEQFDDITMLAFTYLGKSERYCLNIKSNKDEFSKVYDFVNQSLEGKIDEKKKKHLLVSLDEVLANISDYGYQDEPGPINIVINVEENQIITMVADACPPFNPLESKDPNTELSAEERQIGGLGIFMVKRLTDEVHYQNIFGRNCLTMIIRK